MNPQSFFERVRFRFNFQPGFVYPVVVESSISDPNVGDFVTTVNGISLKYLSNSRLKDLISCFRMERFQKL